MTNEGIVQMILRYGVLILAIFTFFIWRNKHKVAANTRMETVAVLMCISSALSVIFAMVSILNKSLFAIDSWILNVASNTVRIQLLASLLVSGLLFDSRDDLITAYKEAIEVIAEKLEK